MSRFARRPWLVPDAVVGDLRVLAPAFDVAGERLHLAIRADGTAVALEVVDWHSDASADDATRAALPLVGRALDGVLPLLEAGCDGPRSWRVLEPFDGGSLLPPRGILPAAERLHVARTLAEALVALHAIGAVHGDLRAACVVRDRGGAPRIFGAARLPAARIGIGPERIGPSPEQSLGHPASPASDAHALGMLLYRLAAGRDPFFDGAHPLEPATALAIASAPSMTAVSSADQQLVTLARRLMRKAPADRPSARDALEAIEGIERGAPAAGGRRARMVGRATQPMPTFEAQGPTVAVRGPLPPEVRDALLDAGFAVRPAALSTDAPVLIALDADRATLRGLVQRHAAVLTDVDSGDAAELAALIRLGIAGVLVRPLDPQKVRRRVIQALRGLERG